MSLRALNLTLTTLTLLAIGVPIIDQPDEPTTTLRVESLSRHPLQVRMSLKVLGAKGVQTAQRVVVDSVFAPPANFEIADSIRTIHLHVKGFGSLRAEVRNDAVTGATPIVAEGRDVTFRGDGEGHFNRVWTAAKTARHVDQLIISPGTFSGGGDSGSLIVTDDANLNPVALQVTGPVRPR